MQTVAIKALPKQFFHEQAVAEGRFTATSTASYLVIVAFRELGAAYLVISRGLNSHEAPNELKAEVLRVAVLWISCL